MKCLYCSEKSLHEGLCNKHLEIGYTAGALINQGIIPTVEVVAAALAFLRVKFPDIEVKDEELPELMKEYKVLQ